MVKARDLNGDGHLDLFVGTTWQTQSRLLLGDGAAGFTEVTETHLPNQDASVGDAARREREGQRVPADQPRDRGAQHAPVNGRRG